ncbi:hypothetical protein PMIN06_000181 [Paraphaeosphaeria minitans]
MAPVHPSTQPARKARMPSLAVAMESWSVEHRLFHQPNPASGAVTWTSAAEADLSVARSTVRASISGEAHGAMVVKGRLDQR